jgi:hypothetical protein
VSACSEASKRRCNLSAASFNNAAGKLIHDGLSLNLKLQYRLVVNFGQTLILTAGRTALTCNGLRHPRRVSRSVDAEKGGVVSVGFQQFKVPAPASAEGQSEAKDKAGKTAAVAAKKAQDLFKKYEQKVGILEMYTAPIGITAIVLSIVGLLL